jgi:polysaccharide pyruvyl transferase WcaK-like protein
VSSDAPEIVKVFSKYVSFFILIVDIIIYKLTGGCLFFQKVCGFFKNLDVIYYIGGGYFSEDWPKRLYIEFIVVNMAKIYNPELKIIGTGMGIGPFRKRLPLYMLREFFSKFDYIFTREEESLLSLRQLGIKA